MNPINVACQLGLVAKIFNGLLGRLCDPFAVLTASFTVCLSQFDNFFLSNKKVRDLI